MSSFIEQEKLYNQKINYIFSKEKDETFENNYNVKKFPSDKYVIGFAPVQSGKTEFCIKTCAYYLENKITPICITKDRLGDKNQLVSRLEQYKKNNNLNFQVITVTNLKEKSFEFNENQIFVVLGNTSQLKLVTKQIYKSSCKFSLLVDEIDDVLYGSKDAIDPEHVVYDINENYDIDFFETNYISRFRNYLSVLIQMSKQVLGLTATPNIPLYVTKFSIINIPYRSYLYKGICSESKFNINVIEPTKFISRNDAFTDEQNINDIIDSILVEFLKKSIIKAKLLHSTSVNEELYFYHPNIMLLDICSAITLHENFSKLITTKYNISTISYNGQGAILYTKNKIYNAKNLLPTDSILNNNIYCYKYKTISKCLDDMKKVNSDTHIAILAGKLTCRGISYTSSCSSKKWHLTEQVLLAPSSITSTNLHQSLRLSGINNDDIPLYLYTTEHIFNDLKCDYELNKYNLQLCTKGISIKDVTYEPYMIPIRRVSDNKNITFTTTL